MGRVNDNSIHIGLGGDFPSKEVKYFINITSFILLNFLWCGIYYSQLPDGQLTAEKGLIFPKTQDDRPLCAWWNGLWWMESLIHLLIYTFSQRETWRIHYVSGTPLRTWGGGGDGWSTLAHVGVKKLTEANTVQQEEKVRSPQTERWKLSW